MNLRVFCLLFFATVFSPLAHSEDYVVQNADTLAQLAAKTKTPLAILKTNNPTVDWEALKPGTPLAVPERYTVKPGDTVYSLARTFGIEQSALLHLNQLSSATQLKAGGVLFVPSPSSKVLMEAFFWPIPAPPRNESGKFRGVSFEGSGRDFQSVCDGVVTYVGEFRGLGQVLLIENSEKNIFGFGNFESNGVNFGQKVKKGQVLGRTSSRSSQRLLFFVIHQGEALDPFQARR